MPSRFPVLLAFAFLVLFAACGSNSNNNSNQVKNDSINKPPAKIDSSRHHLGYPKAMNITRKSAFDSFYLRMGDSMYYCSYKGIMESADSLGSNKKFLFDLHAEYIIDEIYLYPTDAHHFFVVWQETDHMGVKSYFAKFERGNSKPMWKMRIEAPSPGPPVVDSPNVYISTLGVIAKINMNTGKEEWKHDSLFDPLKLVYKEFDRPLIYQASVCFFDFPINGKKNRRDSIWVNDATGRIGR